MLIKVTCLDQSIFIILGKRALRVLREHIESDQGAPRALSESNQRVLRALLE